MRFVWAVVAFVLATLLIGAGIAQRTVFLGPSSDSVALQLDEPAPFVLIDGEVLRTHPGSQGLLVRGEGQIFMAYGRTSDITAWLADSTYESVTVAKSGDPVTKLVPASVAPPAPAEGEAATGRNPAGSDLWLDSFTDDKQLVSDAQLPEGMSVLVAADGTADAPSDIRISWPLDTSTPWVGPLIALGCLVLLIGLVLYGLGIRHQRRGRGPRRKGFGPLPATEPIDLSIEAAEVRRALKAGNDKPAAAPENADADAADADAPVKDTPEEEGTVKSIAKPVRRPVRRRWWALPALMATVLAVSGCSADSWPQLGEGATPTPTPTPTVVAPENQKPPAVTETQAARILKEISETVAEADKALDADLAATRLDGAALTARRADYALRAELPDRAALPAIPSGKIQVLLPQAIDTWPRTVMVLAESSDDETVPPVMMMMSQADQWSSYKVSNVADMQAGAKVPSVAPAWLGATTITDSASAFLSLPPAEMAETFADIADLKTNSASWDRFDDIAQNFTQAIYEVRQDVARKLAAENADKTSKLEWDITPTTAAPISLATLDSGAIVAVSLVDREKITPTTSDAVIRFEKNPVVMALTGAKESAKGAITTYELQLFFAIPNQGSDEPIKLLAARQDVIAAEVIK